MAASWEDLLGSLLYWWRHPFPFWPMADAVRRPWPWA